MECGKMSDLIMKYLDGNISEVELKLLNRHMISCEKCSKEFEIMTEISELINELPEISAPADFESKVMHRIKQQKAQTSMVNMLIGAVGLFIFAYYMILFVIVPFFQERGAFQMILGYSSFILNLIGEYITRIIVYLPITIENLLILRSILIKDYMNIMLLIASGVILLNMGLIKVINLQQE